MRSTFSTRRRRGKRSSSSCEAGRCRLPAAGAPTMLRTMPWPGGWKPSWIARRRPTRTRVARRTFIASIVPSMRMRFAICLAWRPTARCCFHPTNRRTDSTRMLTRFRWCPRCSIAIWQRQRRFPASPSAIPRFGPRSNGTRPSGTARASGHGCGKRTGWAKSFLWDQTRDISCWHPA